MDRKREDVVNIMFMIDFLHGYSGGGTERHLSHLVRNLDRSKYKSYVVAFDMGESALIRGIRERGVEVIHLPVKRYYGPKGFARALELSRLIRKLEIDIVQTFHYKADTYGALVARLAGVDAIVSSKRDIGDTKSQIHLLVHRMTKFCFAGCIVVAEAVGESVVRKEGIGKNKIRVIYNGVDLEKYRPPDSESRRRERARIGLADDDFVVGMVAVFRPEKNHDIFFQAARVLSEEIPTLRIVCVGGGILLETQRRLCTQNGLEDRVVFTGAADDVVQYLTTFDVGCLVPGSNEGFSNAILEKMAMGLPMVVSDVGGNREAVVDGFNGFVIPPCDVGALIQSVRLLHEDRTRRLEMGVRSRERVEEEFSLGRMIQEHEVYYDELVAGRHAAA